MSVHDAMRLYEKFKEIDFDMSGVVDLDEFFEHLREEKTPFATQLFTLIGPVLAVSSLCTASS